MSRVSAVAVLFSSLLVTSVADAQTLGTFRWRTAPFCNVFNLTVTQHGSAFTLDGFDDGCGANLRHAVHGIGAPQLDGTITLGLSIVHDAASPVAVALRATINPATISGTWVDDGGHAGDFTFNPGAVTGAPRPAVTSSGGNLPDAFVFQPGGGFAAVATGGGSITPASGPGSRMMWHAGKSAFRAGRVEFSEWEDINIGLYSTAFGNRTVAVGGGSFAATATGKAVTPCACTHR